MFSYHCFFILLFLGPTTFFGILQIILLHRILGVKVVGLGEDSDPVIIDFLGNNLVNQSKW